MKIKRLTERQLKRKVNYLKKTNPKSRWIPYINYHLRKQTRTKRRLKRMLKFP